LTEVTFESRGTVIGSGASSEVIAWDPGRVAKVFRPRYAYAVELELGRARAVQALGAPCPAVFEQIEHEGRPGIVFERVDGVPLSDGLFQGSESIAGIAERLAALQLQIHEIRVPPDSPLPRLEDAITRYLEAVPEDEREGAREELDLIPSDTGLCHMDLHPINVIARGSELVAVDWVNACSGALALDAARSFTLMAYQSASKRDGRRQSARLELGERYLEAVSKRAAFAPGEIGRALGFAAMALLRGEPRNPFASELRALISWRR
jgi:aminoglycoside phosphotransferase (APT) family kinase protein